MLDSTAAGWGPVAGFNEHENENSWPSYSIKAGKYFACISHLISWSVAWIRTLLGEVNKISVYWKTKLFIL